MSLWDRDGTSSGYTPHTQDVVPTVLKWLLAWEDPATKVLWLGKGIPRVWLSPGETIVAEGMPTRTGRIDLRIESAANSYAVNLTLLAGFAWPQGGMKLRLRSPAHPKRQIASATVGGKAWPAAQVSAAEETIALPEAVDAAALQAIVVKLSA